MRAALKAGLSYFAIVFAAGFLLGAIRTIWLEPALGGIGAVVAELPVMLAMSFAAAIFLTRRFAAAGTGPLLAMGGLAFVLLQAAELGLAQVMGVGLGSFAASLSTTKGMLGMAGQIVFGLMPLLVGRRAA